MQEHNQFKEESPQEGEILALIDQHYDWLSESLDAETRVLLAELEDEDALGYICTIVAKNGYDVVAFLANFDHLWRGLSDDER